jgi:RNase P/RNase MRP subunit POP5
VDGDQRTRYIAFESPTPAPSRHELNTELGPPSWRLTVYDDGVGVLRVPHTDAEAARAALEAAGARPVTTSGTIRNAKQAVGADGS